MNTLEDILLIMVVIIWIGIGIGTVREHRKKKREQLEEGEIDYVKYWSWLDEDDIQDNKSNTMQHFILTLEKSSHNKYRLKKQLDDKVPDYLYFHLDCPRKSWCARIPEDLRWFGFHYEIYPEKETVHSGLISVFTADDVCNLKKIMKYLDIHGTLDPVYSAEEILEVGDVELPKLKESVHLMGNDLKVLVPQLIKAYYEGDTVTEDIILKHMYSQDMINSYMDKDTLKKQYLDKYKGVTRG